MPESTDRTSSPVLPKFIVSRPKEESSRRDERPSLATRRRSEPPPSLLRKEQGRTTSSEWIDVDESPPPRRKRAKKRSGQNQDRASSKSTNGKQTSPRSFERELGRFFPSLSRITEVNESNVSSRGSTASSERRRRRERSSTKRSRYAEEPASNHRRPPVKHRVGSAPRRGEGSLKVNESLLSVLSSLTGSSGRSSGSGSTITQDSYYRRGAQSPEAMARRAKRNEYDLDIDRDRGSGSKSPNVFDYMENATVEDGEDGRSVVSSSPSSHFAPSDAGSSEAPGTPSSRSTFPSPTTTRSLSATELRTKHVAQYAGANAPARSDSKSPDPSIRSLRKQPSVSDVPEEGEEANEANHELPRTSTSRSSWNLRRGSDQIYLHEESMRQHMAQIQQGHFVEPVYGQHRSSSTGSGYSDRSAHAYRLAMQQYQWPPAPIPPPAMNGHISPTERPAEAESPDLSQRTLTGYEMLALELSNSESAVKPLYRKFEYLNHRILLHLQDELSELEEQLRTVDEVIAQMDMSISPDGQKIPASRRSEAFHGNEIYLRRTHLLGRIFVKTEQYNKAMSSYAAMANGSTAADGEQVSRYREWMSKHVPIHEVETRFLQQDADLISPGKPATAAEGGLSKHAALAYLPAALMLPLLLFSIIPSLAGRLIVTALIAVGAFVAAATTSVRQLMGGRDWAVCGGAYVLVMAAIAGCIPLR